MGQFHAGNMPLFGHMERGNRHMGAHNTGSTEIVAATFYVTNGTTENLKTEKAHPTFKFQYFSTGC